MSDASVALKARFHVAQTYDFTGAFAISFMWYGGGDEFDDIRFTIETKTGNLITTFPDGDPVWRQVYLPLSQFNKTGTGGGLADLRNVTGIFWRTTTPGMRRLDWLQLHEEPTLKGIFSIRRSAELSLKAKFFVYHHPDSANLKAKFTVG